MWQRSLRGIAACTLLVAASPALASPAADPLENVNRRIHAFNRGLQAHVLGPLVELYQSATTPEIRRSVGNAVANLGEPIVAASGLAGGQVEIALNAVARFGINTTLGIAGVHDRAAEMGYPQRSYGLGDALCGWGVPSGPFLMLPVFGPSTLRDAGAWFATSAALSQAVGPDLVTGWSTSNAFVGYERAHRELNQLDAQALDPYAVYRSVHLARRAAACEVDRARLATIEATEDDTTGEDEGSR